MPTKTIDLSVFLPLLKVYGGTQLGEHTREIIGLTCDSVEKIEFSIPKDSYTLTRSFFLGLFSKDFKHLKTEEEFRNKYSFDVPEYIRPNIDEFIKDVYLTKGHL